MIGRPHLDINITTRCNMACVGCSHLAPVAAVEVLTPDMVLKDLLMLKPLMRFTQICLVGGEPTIHPEVHRMVILARWAKMCDEVVVITNGKRMPTPEFWNEMRPIEGLPSTAIRLSVYPTGNSLLRKKIKEACDENGVRYEELEFNEFYSQFKATPDDGAETFKNCAWKNDCYTLHKGKLYRCPQSVFFHKLFAGLIEGEDGLALDGATESGIEAFLNSETPLKACSVCSGGSSHPFKWEENRDKSQWIQKATI